MMARMAVGTIGALVGVTLTGSIAASQEAVRPAPDAPHKRHFATQAPHAVRPKARHARAESVPDASQAQPAQDHPIATKALPPDPISLGMKWNGSSDNAEQTRVQNYGGTATGSGAEVGLKLHF